jgi:hypothetical protein
MNKKVGDETNMASSEVSKGAVDGDVTSITHCINVNL